MEKPTGLPVPPLRSWRGASKLEIESPSVVTRFQPIDDPRRHPRFKMVTDIKVYSRNCGLLKGRTADISESGLAAGTQARRTSRRTAAPISEDGGSRAIGGRYCP